MTSRFDDIKARLEAASPGPWFVDGDGIKHALGQEVALWRLPGRDPQPWHRPDAEFIAHARQDIADLLAERESLTELLDAWREFYLAVRPVTRAEALLAFSHSIYELGADLTGDDGWLSDPNEDARER